MNKTPIVSFVLPAYKRRYLHEAIASILAQTFHDFELIVVDDCSPEDLKPVVDEFHDERLRYYRNQKNVGGQDLVAAWEIAVGYARGEWCVVAADDDIYMPEFLDEMLRLSNKYPKTDIFHCRIASIGEDGGWRGVSQPRLEYETQVQMAYYRGGMWSFQVAPDFMFRIRALREIGGFVKFPHAWYTDDATWMVLAKNGVGYSDRILYFHREFPNSVSFRHDNIMGKLKASEMFKSWFKDFIVGLSPMNTEERCLLRGLLENAIARVDCLTSSSFKYATLAQLFSVLVDNHYSLKLRRSIFWSRFPRIYALRRLLLP